MIFRHIDTAKKAVSAGRSCALFGVCASGFYAWKGRGSAAASSRSRTRFMAARACMWNCKKAASRRPFDV